jgi:TonB-linked SusC/RagA family outer membrane protein
MLDTYQFSEIISEARINAGQTPDGAWSNPETLPNTNWVDEIFAGSGLEQTYNLSISGGNENSQFFISGAYDREEGIMVNNWFERYAVRANSDFKLGEKIKIGQSLLVSRTGENPTADNGGDLATIFRAIPIMPVRDPENPFGGWGTGPTYFQGPNPLAAQMQNHIRENVNRINGNAYAEYNVIDGLKIRGSIGVNLASLANERFSEAFNYGALANPISRLTHRSRSGQEINTNLVVTYGKTFGKHDFSVMAGYESFKADGTGFTANAQEFPVSYTRSFALATGAVDISDRNTVDTQYRLQSVFGRINYSFANKYLLTMNIRRDGSSRFGALNQFGVFPSFSVGWRLIEEEFMQGIDWLSDLKIRASYGILGSDRIPDYIFSPTYRNNRSTYAFDPTGMSGGTKMRGFYLRRFPNQEVKWEEVVQTDIGLDVGFLDGKFNLTADYYIKNTTDMLIGVQLPPSFGVSQSRSNPESTQINIGEVENRGLELALNYRERVGDWSFDITGNAAWNRNEVKLLNEGQQIFSGGGGHGWEGNINLTEAGNPMGSFFGWETVGIFQTQEEVDALNAASPSGVYQNNLTSPGDLRFRDINNDGIINANDRTIIGNPWPELIYGLNANINFKNFDMTIFFQGVQGVDIFNATRQYTRNLFTDYNTSTLVYERWTPENPTNQPRLIAGDPNGNYRRPSSHHVEDGSFLRLRNIQFGYSLPNGLLDKLGMRNARVFVNAQNLLTFTAYEGVDPEIGRGDNTNRGIDNFSGYPQTTLVSTGIQVGF